MSQLIQLVAPDQVQYMLIRIPVTVDDTSATVISTTRDVMVAWTGPKVNIIERGRKQTHFGAVSQVLQPIHANLTATSVQAFTEFNIRLKSDPLSGSHVID